MGQDMSDVKLVTVEVDRSDEAIFIATDVEDN
jgi:hypothetical protein